MSVVEKALWIVERNSARKLSLTDIAGACGVSRSHLSSAFGSATGRPLIAYLRARRLSMAASALAAGAPDILEVALDAGYGSHEAFTRAFCDQFGITPERVRDRHDTGGLALVEPLELPLRPGRRLEPPRLLRAPAIRAVGLVRRQAFDALARIPSQWQAFVARMDGIPNRRAGMPVGLAYPAGDDGFDYACACEVSAFGKHPRDLADIELPARRYAVFEHRGHVSTVFDTYAAIWNEALPAGGWHPADAPAIERHHPAFDPDTGEGGLSLYVPLADTSPFPCAFGDAGHPSQAAPA